MMKLEIMYVEVLKMPRLVGSNILECQEAPWAKFTNDLTQIQNFFHYETVAYIIGDKIARGQARRSEYEAKSEKVMNCDGHRVRELNFIFYLFG